MKWRAVALTIALLSQFAFSEASKAATPKVGSACAKAGQASVSGSTKLICVKSGKKFVWKVFLARANGIPAPTPVPASLVGTNCTRKLEDYSNTVIDTFDRHTLICQGDSGSSTGFWAVPTSYLHMACDQVSATLQDPQSQAVLTCLPFTGLGTINPAITRWALAFSSDGSVHSKVSAALDAYYRVYNSPTQQTDVENRITSDLEYQSFVQLLVKGVAKDYPGFANVVSTELSLKDAIKPWAEQLARKRNLPIDTFYSPSDFFLSLLEKSTEPVNQSVFERLFSRAENLKSYAARVDRRYWLWQTPPTQANSIVIYHYLDSLLLDPDSLAQVNYYQNDLKNAKFVFPDYANQLDLGQSMDQAMNFWIARFAAGLELPPTAVDGPHEPILFSAALKPPLNYSIFDSAVRQDPRWDYTSQARNAASSLANSILCAFGYRSC
jgi:hypothetical protein